MTAAHYSLYILYSEKIDQYYVGISQEPATRLHAHNTAPTGWTQRGRPWKLVFQQSLGPKREALRVERFVKAQKSKQFIERILTGEVTLESGEQFSRGV